MDASCFCEKPFLAVMLWPSGCQKYVQKLLEVGAFWKDVFPGAGCSAMT